MTTTEFGWMSAARMSAADVRYSIVCGSVIIEVTVWPALMANNVEARMPAAAAAWAPSRRGDAASVTPTDRADDEDDADLQSDPPACRGPLLGDIDPRRISRWQAEQHSQ